MPIIKLKIINKINWIIFWFCLFISILILYFEVFTFVSNNLGFYGSLTISGLFICNMGAISVRLWWENIYPDDYVGSFKLKDIVVHYDNNLSLRLLFTIIAGLLLSTTLTFGFTSLYTNVFGTKAERIELVLYKTAHTQIRGVRDGRISGQYSARLTNINRKIKGLTQITQSFVLFEYEKKPFKSV